MLIRTLLVCALVSSPLVLAQSPAPADAIANVDELWKTRDDGASLKEADKLLSEGLKAAPNDYALLWRAARQRWWVADGASEEKLKKQLGKEGWNLAERALKAKPGGMEGHYYTALNIGAYSQAVGILKALSEGLEGKFVENLDAAIKADETFDRTGGRNAKGRYYWELPWPKRDLAKSYVEFDAVLKRNPEHLRAQLYKTESLLKDGKAAEAKVMVDKVLAGDCAYDPPECKRVRTWAKPVKEKIEEELK
jgi:hypothetical protein